MKLVRFENYNLVIEPEALHIKAFKRLWDRDRSQSKNKAKQELGIIYFQIDPRSDYMFITDDAERLELIKEHEGLPEDWQPDKLVIEAMDVWKQLIHTPNTLLLHDSIVTADNLRKYLRKIDLDERDERHRPIYSPNVITNALKQIPDIVKALVETKRLVEQEINESNKMRGSQQKKIFEDGL